MSAARIMAGNLLPTPRISRSALLCWRVASPLRAYVRWSPIGLGKRFLSNRLLAPILPPPPAEFDAELPSGDHVRLQYREAIGLSWLLYGAFERAEIEFAIASTEPGGAAVDVGAHAGLYTTALARAVGSDGTVFAFEPSNLNVARLRGNLERSGLTNVVIYCAAAAARDQPVLLRLANDPAYSSTSKVFEDRSLGESTVVPGVCLDSAWLNAGRPRISFVKIDVEGAELDVLAGAESLLGECRPSVLIEAASDAARASLDEWFEARAFQRRLVRGFMPWNHLYESA
jgi:FkbM family methyltransferase